MWLIFEDGYFQYVSVAQSYASCKEIRIHITDTFRPDQRKLKEACSDIGISHPKE